MNIYLIGYRCTGKTSVGKCLSEKIGWDFIDADTALVEKYNMTVSDIVAASGWEDFRDKEADVLQSISRLNNYVVATGGGVILKPQNVATMKRTGHIIWLKASNFNIKQRMLKDLKTDEQRPALTHKKLDDEIEETMAQRAPLYENAMHTFIDTDRLTIDTVCDHIQDMLKGVI